MHSYKRNNLPKHTVEFTVTIPWKDIEAQYQTSFEELRKNLEAEGFRKGKAPKAVAEKKIAKEDIYQHLIRSILPNIYDEIVKKEELKPLISPRIELVKAQENQDWEIKLTTAEYPEIKLGDYKAKVKEAKKNVQKSDIWVPGKDQKESKEDTEKKKQAEFNAALNAVLEEVKIEIPELIIEEESNNRLAKLVDDIQKVGLNIDSYLQSKNMTKDQLNNQIRKEIEETYKMEFILQKIADEEGIKVEKEDMDKVFGSLEKEEDRKAMEQNAYYYATLLRKQKTLDYINSL